MNKKNDQSRVDLRDDSQDSPTASMAGGASTVAQHSPLPWRAIESSGPHDSCVVTAEGDGVADVCQSRADARFIVTAANAHADLVLALQCFVDRYVALVNCGDCGNWNPEHDVEVIRARAALAKAEGR